MKSELLCIRSVKLAAVLAAKNPLTLWIPPYARHRLVWLLP